MKPSKSIKNRFYPLKIYNDLHHLPPECIDNSFFRFFTSEFHHRRCPCFSDFDILIILIKEKLSIKKKNLPKTKHKGEISYAVLFSFLESHFKFLPPNVSILSARYSYSMRNPFNDEMHHNTTITLYARQLWPEIIKLLLIVRVNFFLPAPATANNNNRNIIKTGELKPHTKPSHSLKQWFNSPIYWKGKIEMFLTTQTKKKKNVLWKWIIKLIDSKIIIKTKKNGILMENEIRKISKERETRVNWSGSGNEAHTKWII